jgi:hypothetical protein
MMENKKDEWIKIITDLLEEPTIKFGTLYEILVEMKRSRLEQGYVLELLTELRLREFEQYQDDLILEMLDVVSGYCSPHLRLW